MRLTTIYNYYYCYSCKYYYCYYYCYYCYNRTTVCVREGVMLKMRAVITLLVWISDSGHQD